MVQSFICHIAKICKAELLMEANGMQEKGIEKKNLLWVT